MTSIAPGSASRIGNEYYKTDEEFIHACAEAMREEYKAIVDAGLVLQLDDPSIAENWDMINPAPVRGGVPEVLDDPGGGAQPRAARAARRSDPLPPLLGQLARPARHRHPDARHRGRDAGGELPGLLLRGRQRPPRARVAGVGNVKLPAGKILIPGVVSHATNVIEHPELVADRIGRFARLVGREAVIAGTDCGLGGRVHPQLAWAKLQSLAQGAALATKQLWH